MVFEWWIVWEAVGRLANPPEVQGTMVLVIASVGLLINLMIMRWLHGSHGFWASDFVNGLDAY